MAFVRWPSIPPVHAPVRVAPSTTPSRSTSHVPHTQRRYRMDPATDPWVLTNSVSAAGRPQPGHSLVFMPPACCNGSVHFNPYGGAAAQVAAALVNSDTDDPGEIRELMLDGGMTEQALTHADGRAIADWSRRLRPAFDSPDLTTRIDTLNELLADSACLPYISRHDGAPPHLHYADETTGTLSRIRAYTAGGLAHALCEDPARVGVCDREGCDTVYVDTSRNGRRRFCTTRCASRVHVADHRRRTRD